MVRRGNIARREDLVPSGICGSATVAHETMNLERDI
jgi:hypothetical protein